MADSTIFGLTQETALTAAHRLAVQDTAATTRAQSATFALLGGLESATGTDANTTMAVGTLYAVDVGAFTADRTYTLPVAAQVGERIGIAVTTGDDAFELIITAGTSDTLNGVAGGTEWSRVFITGEVVIMRCITADSSWIVESDGRIPCQARISDPATTYTSGFTGGAYSTVQFSTAGTDELAVGDLADIANDRLVIRRAGIYAIDGSAVSTSTSTPRALSFVDGAGTSRGIHPTASSASSSAARTQGFTTISVDISDLGGNGAIVGLEYYQQSTTNQKNVIGNWLAAYERLTG